MIDRGHVNDFFRLVLGWGGANLAIMSATSGDTFAFIGVALGLVSTILVIINTCLSIWFKIREARKRNGKS